GRIGAEDAEQTIGEGGARAPRLLAVQHVVVAVQPRRGADGGHVAAGVRLRPSLRPDLVAARHAWKVARLLCRRPELHERRAEEEDAVLVHAPGRLRAVVLLLEDEPLDQVGAAPAVLDGPGDHRPAALVQRALPGAVLLEALGRVHRLEPCLRHVGGEPLARLATEGLLLRREGEIHGYFLPLSV